MIRITICDGKYTVLVPEESEWGKENFECLRHGEPWRDLCGDNMVLALCQEIGHLQDACRSMLELEERRMYEHSDDLDKPTKCPCSGCNTLRKALHIKS